MGHRSGKYSTLERRTAVLMYENGFTLKEIAEILYRKNPAAIRQGIQRWRQEIITVATSVASSSVNL